MSRLQRHRRGPGGHFRLNFLRRRLSCRARVARARGENGAPFRKDAAGASVSRPLSRADPAAHPRQALVAADARLVAQRGLRLGGGERRSLPARRPRARRRRRFRRAAGADDRRARRRGFALRRLVRGAAEPLAVAAALARAHRADIKSTSKPMRGRTAGRSAAISWREGLVEIAAPEHLAIRMDAQVVAVGHMANDARRAQAICYPAAGSWARKAFPRSAN